MSKGQLEYCDMCDKFSNVYHYWDDGDFFFCWDCKKTKESDK